MNIPIHSNPRLIHIICEMIILVSLVFFFSKKTNNLKSSILNLNQRLELQEETIRKHEILFNKILNPVPVTVPIRVPSPILSTVPSTVPVKVHVGTFTETVDTESAQESIQSQSEDIYISSLTDEDLDEAIKEELAELT